MPVSLDADDLQGEEVALSDHLLGVLDAAVNQLRNVDQPFDRAFNAGEGAERDQLRHQSRDHLTLVIRIDNGIPLCGVGPAQAERYLLVLSVDLRHVDVDFVTDFEELIW